MLLIAPDFGMSVCASCIEVVETALNPVKEPVPVVKSEIVALILSPAVLVLFSEGCTEETDATLIEVD